MAIISCPKCGKKVSDKAEKCPHCGCLKDEINKTLLALAENISNEHASVQNSPKYIEKPLVGYVLKFNVQKKKYFDLRRQFEITACKLRNRLSDYYSSTKYLGTILQNVPNMVAESLHEAIELAILVLSQHNVLITTE